MSTAVKSGVNKNANANNNGNGNGQLKGGSGGNSLQSALEKVATKKKPPKLELPPMERADKTTLELLELQMQEAGQLDHATAESVGKWLEDECLPFIEEVDKKVRQLGERIRDLVCGLNDEGEKVTYGQQRDDYMQRKTDYLSAVVPITVVETVDGAPFLFDALETRKVAHMAVLKHRLKPQMDREQLLNLRDQLVKEGYWKEDREGYICLWKNRYLLSDAKKFGELGEDEERLLAEIVGHHVNRINAVFKEDSQQQAEELKKLGEIDLADLLSHKAGKCFVHVPAEIRNERRLSEVSLLVEGDGKGRAVVLNAVGADKEKALAIKDRKIFLWLPTLEVPRPPRIDTLKEKGFSEDDAKLLQIFWGYIDRARCAQEEKRRREEERQVAEKEEQEEKTYWERAIAEASDLKQAYANDPCLVPTDRIFLEMDTVEGVFYAEFQGDWHNPNGTIIPAGLLFFQGEQKLVADDKGDLKPHIRVKQAPQHLAERFFTEQNMEFTPCGYFFNRLGQPLQAVMKALCNRFKREHQ